MEVSWYQVKQREDRHRFSSMASDALLGLKIIETKTKVGAAIEYSSSELKKLLHTGEILINSILGGIEFLRGSVTTKSLNPELIFVINRIRREDYLSLDELEEKCRIALEALQHVESGKPSLERLSAAEHLFNDIATSSRIESRTLF
jgi:hypothetical protein